MSLSQQASVALRRAAATCRHLHGERSSTTIEEGQEQLLGCASTSAVGELAFDPAVMSLLMLPRNREDLHKVWQLAKEPLFAEYQPDLSLSEQRDLCFRRMKRVVEAKIFSVRDLETDPHRFCNVMAALSLLDMSVVVKFAAQYSLMGGGLLSLGSQRHQHLVDAVTSLDLLGCFAMSELGHGSDVRGLETTATYDPQTKEFIIHTPTTLAQKYWIGGALTAEKGIVFAQLVMPDGTNHGIHTFICPIHRPLSAEARSTASLETVPGVTVTDVGVKLGLNGVDNGCIRFDRVHVPRENLLDRFGNVDENGVYSSPISDPVRRFAAHLGELVGGRVLLQAAGTTVAKQGLIIATRYALSRTQFGVRLMDYLSHQRRLLPLIAEAYAHTFINNFVIHSFATKKRTGMGVAKEVHILASAMKPHSTWFMSRTLQMARECCGGLGYRADSQFSLLKADSDAFLTFEGDNTVLYQQVARELLTQYVKGCRNGMQFKDTWMSYINDIQPLFQRTTSSSNLDSFQAEQLLCPHFQLKAFQFHEGYLVRELAERIKAQRQKSQAEAWNDNLDIALQAADAFAERLVLQHFLDGIARADKSLQPMLRKLYCLYALGRLEKHLGFFLSTNFLPSSTNNRDTGAPLHRIISNHINEHCVGLRPHVCSLLAGWGFPDAVVRAPIAHRGY